MQYFKKNILLTLSLEQWLYKKQLRRQMEHIQAWATLRILSSIPKALIQNNSILLRDTLLGIRYC